MKAELETLANAFYTEWLKINDPFIEDFEFELVKLTPNIQWSNDGQKWFIVQYLI